MLHKNLSREYEMYLNSEKINLSDVYRNYSNKKEQAFKRCQEFCRALHSSKMRIISHNTFIFTVGFICDGPTSGEPMFVYITPTYDFSDSLADLMVSESIA